MRSKPDGPPKSVVHLLLEDGAVAIGQMGLRGCKCALVPRRDLADCLPLSITLPLSCSAPSFKNA